MAQIEIELIIVMLLVFLVIGWATWHRISLWRARRKYNLKEDLSKYGEEKRRAKLEGREPNPSAATVVIPEPSAIAERIILPSAASDVIGEDNRSAVSDSNADKGLVSRIASRIKRRKQKG